MKYSLTTDLRHPLLALGQELRAAEGEVLLDDVREGGGGAIRIQH